MNSGWGVHCKGIICHTPSAAFTDSPYKVLIGYIILQNGLKLCYYVSPNTPTKGYGQCACMVCLYRIRAQPFLHILDFLRSMLSDKSDKGFPRMDALLPLFPPCAGSCIALHAALLRFLPTRYNFVA